MRRRRSRGPAMVSGRIRFAPSIASIKRNGTPPQWSPCRWVRMIASSELCSMPCCARAISDEVPKSIAKRELGPSTRMHVWKRPPLPNESPEPTKRTLTGIPDIVGASGRGAAPSQVRGPAPPVDRLGVVDDVHGHELLGAVREGGRDRREPVGRFRDDLARIVDDAPPPRGILRRVECGDLHLSILLAVQ